MKLSIKQIGAQIQAPKSTLQATNTSLADLENQFAQWIIRGLSQMDWSEFESYELAIDTLKLPDIDIDLAQIDWQHVQQDPFSAFKCYVYPQLKNMLERHLQKAKQTSTAQHQYAVSEAVKRQGIAHLNLDAQRFLIYLLADKPPTQIAKATLKLELKRLITQAFKAQKNALPALQHHPSWPKFRDQLVTFFRHEPAVLFALLAPFYPSDAHAQLKTLLTKLSPKQVSRFISWLEQTISNQSSVQLTSEKQQQRTLLLSVHEQFVATHHFDERLLQQVCLALNWPKHRQAIAMWCAVQSGKTETGSVASLKRIVMHAASNTDLTIELVDGSAFTAKANKPSSLLSQSRLPAQQKHSASQIESKRGQHSKSALLRDTLIQLRSLLQQLVEPQALLEQKLKVWLALQAFRANQPLLTAGLVKQLGLISKEVSDTWLGQNAPQAILHQTEQLITRLRAHKTSKSRHVISHFSLMKVYRLLAQLQDVSASLLVAPNLAEQQNVRAEHAIASWLDNVSAWCAQQQKILNQKSGSVFADAIAPQRFISVLSELKTWLLAQQAQQQVPQQLNCHQELDILASAQVVLKSLPILSYSNLWLRVNSIGNVATLHEVLDKLLNYCQSFSSKEQIDNKEIQPVKAMERSLEYSLSQQIELAYQQLNSNLQELQQQLQRQHALLPATPLQHQALTPVWQCVLRVKHIAKLAYTSQLSYQGAIGRLYAFVAAQKTWFVYELSLLPSNKAALGEQGEKLVRLLAANIKTLQTMSKTMTQAVPQVARSYSSPDAWLQPLLDGVCEQVGEDNHALFASLLAPIESLPSEQENADTPVSSMATASALPAELQALYGTQATQADNNAQPYQEGVKHEFAQPPVASEASTTQSNDKQSQAQLTPAFDFEKQGMEANDEQPSQVQHTECARSQQQTSGTAPSNQRFDEVVWQTQASASRTTTLAQHQRTEELEATEQAASQFSRSDQVVSKEQSTAQANNSVHAAFPEQIATVPLSHAVKGETAGQQHVVSSETQSQPARLVRALMQVQTVEQAQQLLTGIEKRIASRPLADITTESRAQLQSAVTQSRNKLRTLHKATASKAGQGLVTKAMQQVKAQLEQLQQVSEQLMSPVTFDVGLVIVWPFLPTLFSKLSLLHDSEHEQAGMFVDEHALMLAHAVLCYIANVDPLIEVSHTAKALLGLPLDMEIDDIIELDDKTKTAVDYMLHALVSRWEILKGMPVDEFVRLFIVREGQVEQIETGYHINAETMVQDVLMAKLPWGLGMVQLPWLDQTLLHIEWKYGF
ncbi:hypothetical protein PA25_27630 [Pseudoalteromonas sp. A25]|uniref:contractile injection system tape measure protein n=1 Tax=Pseudoalteromonas sp. A25 TaxID=116092 RepID=UPI001261361D|nr:contractile injection system tape measure protein [Pseudoalteromonas sp. A25]BBN82778.1 hypothetical protein PA25_27630 [Pseudoalteromonas sp. A25]